VCFRSLRDRRHRGQADHDFGDALGEFGHRLRSWARSAAIIRASADLSVIEFLVGGERRR